MEERTKKTLIDYITLAVTTFGVGYIPLAPGTWGSAVGVLIYILVYFIEGRISIFLTAQGWNDAQLTAWVHAFNLVILILFCLLGIWASGRSIKHFRDKDPSQAVVDEVMGQLIVYLFVPFNIAWPLILAGFLLFRLFDIWKPYPIDNLQSLSGGIGICADDILAGIYGGVCLSIIYAITLAL